MSWNKTVFWIIALIFLAMPIYAQTLTFPMSHYYRMETGSGSTAVDYVGLRNGTIYGASFADSKGDRGTGNYSLSYDGTNDYVDIGNIGGFKSVSLWFYPESRVGFDYLFAHNNFRIFEHTTSGNIIFGDSIGGSIDSGFDIDIHQEEWIHVVAVSNGTLSKLYINNASVGSTTLEAVSSGTVNFGRWTGNDHYFHGRLDEIAMFNYSLSQANVTKIYQYGLYKLTVDSKPVITINPDLTTEYIDKNSQNLTINISCLDDHNITSLYLDVLNASDTVIDLENLTGNNPSVIINEYDISNWMTGNYNYYANCSDGSGNLTQSSGNFNIIDESPPIISLLRPHDNAINSTSPVNFDWTTNINTSCSLYFDNILKLQENNSMNYNYLGEFTANTSIEWNVSCTANNITVNSDTRTFNFNYIQPFDINNVSPLSLNECPSNLENMLLLIFFCVFSIAIFIIGYIVKIPILSLLSSFIFIMCGFYVIPCLVIFGVVLALMGICMLAVVGIDVFSGM